MSALADRLHAFLSRFASIGKNDVEQLVTGVEEHLAPLIAQARTELVADVKALVAEVKVDEQKLAAEIAKILGGHTPEQPTPDPAPVEPPAPQA